MKLKVLFVFFTTLLVIMSCKKPDNSDVDFAAWNLSESQVKKCTFTAALQPAVRVCIKGQVSKSIGEATLQKSIKRAINTWFDAIKDIEPNVTEEVEFTCDKYHLIVNANAGAGRSMANCGNIVSLSTGKSEKSVYNSTLHELGHALAVLYDTYVGGTAMKCQSGQPQSVMCGNYNTRDSEGYTLLMDDDIKGFRSQYTRYKHLVLQGDGSAGSGFQHIFVQILDQSAAGTSSKLLLSTPKATASASICDSYILADNCKVGASGAISTTFKERLSEGQSIFESDSEVEIKNNQQYVIVARNADGRLLVNKIIRFVEVK